MADTPRTADADDLRIAAKLSRAVSLDKDESPRATRLEASARLRPLEDAVLDAAQRRVLAGWGGEELDAAVRALKDAKEG